MGLLQVPEWRCLFRPLRGHARSHSIITGLEGCAAPVGAGVPAKRPEQATQVVRCPNSSN
ncbi:hypothetical protein DMX12_13365 [Pseudomonas sp. MB-090624]|nr:hypothetical protein DMX12_13365 [Pseudomonas sp. MB-090624]